MPPSLFENVIKWIRAGYPKASRHRVSAAARTAPTGSVGERDHRCDPEPRAGARHRDSATPERIRDAIHAVTEQAPSEEETRQVAARLAAAGWPLTDRVPVSD
ncbi:DUF3349 domain-containing protein [Gordonia sp. YC-JH1]|uniref:DUF3349 domain-containing protein n=1 Tax=Gordonia sp. YC-JH1 TaxID=2059875 RepID=UPI002D77F9CB|nr:DUF3349 domain-containing protein [Gordonia sp. YC-JH1]